MKRYFLALDLIDDAAAIEEYQHWHKAENGWPEIKKSILDAGICNMEIYCIGNRLLMMIEAGNDFCFERKAVMDAANPKVMEWETLMCKFQKPLPWANNGEKWVLMDKIYQL